MTRKMYLNDAYTTDFTAEILEVVPVDSGFKIELDATYFYPEGGGQPPDTGWIDGLDVTDVQIEGGTIYHYTRESPRGKGPVACQVDWSRRQDFMQQHSAQHILSKAFEDLADANTVGFHLSPNTLTIDLDKPVSDDMLFKAEARANAVIFENRPILIHYPDETALAAMPLRKAPAVVKNIRIVEIQDFDFSPCGGTHFKSTGEIGLVKIVKGENYKNGVRLHFHAGWRTLKDYHEKNRVLAEASRLLSVKPLEVLEALEARELEIKALKKETADLKENLLQYIVKDLEKTALTLNQTTIILREFQGMEPAMLKKMTVLLTREPSRIVLFSSLDKDVKLIFACSDDIAINMNELIKEPLALIEGKGGGQPKSAQGGGPLLAKASLALDRAYELLLEQIH